MKKEPKANPILNGWLSCWLYVITVIGGFFTALLACNWTVWLMATKLTVAGTIALVLHVLEEWKFPGGFYLMYNLKHGARPEVADRYPMSQLTDMITNCVPILFTCVMLAFGMPYVVCVVWFFFSIMEVVVHTMAGFDCIKLFGSKGKKGLYNPGFATAWGCYGPILLGFLYSFVVERAPTLWEILGAIVLSAILSFLCINLPEGTLKREDSPYAFPWGKGYFARFDQEGDK
ncbi:HXXEE domain-containing protein [Gemmiger sp.]|uniref:HXXEE domain-containing protein n=1 Tax=Gemmiger sp. TaxID=2049027 RepID=UPI003F00B5FD